MLLEALAALAILIGSFFVLVGALGLLRLPDFFMRLHAPTKASTLGVGGMLIASLVYGLGDGTASLHEILVAVFIFVTAPVSANLLSIAALQLGVPSRAKLPGSDRADESGPRGNAAT